MPIHPRNVYLTVFSLLLSSCVLAGGANAHDVWPACSTTCSLYKLAGTLMHVPGHPVSPHTHPSRQGTTRVAFSPLAG